MNHLSEEDFVSQYYGEPTMDETAVHLATCEVCSARFGELQRVLNSLGDGAVPERGEDYGAQVWAQIRPRLAGSPARVTNWRAWGAIAAMFALGVVGYLAGRSTSPKLVADGGVKERILLVALTDHLERSQMVLAEIENADAGQGGWSGAAEPGARGGGSAARRGTVAEDNGDRQAAPAPQ